MFEIFRALKNGKIKQGKKVYHLYDCSGKEVIDREFNTITDKTYGNPKYTAIIIENGNGWYSLYTNPKHS